MIRTLLVTALCTVMAMPAQAQGAEIIIRRPGEKDQVIQLDSTRSRARIAEAQRELGQAGEMLQREMGKALQLRVDTEVMGRAMKTLALRDTAFLRQMKALTRVRDLLPGLAARPIIGVTLSFQPRPTDRIGAYVEDVSPGGPADKAGIRAGDIITRLAGKSLTSGNGDSVYSADQSFPSMRLIDIASKLEVGKPVDVEFKRGNDLKTARITPVEENTFMAYTMPTPNAAPEIAGRIFTVPGVPEAPSAPFAPLVRLSTPNGNGYSFSYFVNSGALSNVEMAPMNDKLGDYFGTSEGVLVLDTGINGRDSTGAIANVGNTTFGLQPGDVIVSIDGRKVTTPSQLVRIMASYDSGDTFKLQIMRQKKAETLTARMP